MLRKKRGGVGAKLAEKKVSINYGYFARHISNAKICVQLINSHYYVYVKNTGLRYGKVMRTGLRTFKVE